VNTAAFVLALIGAGLNLFQPVISVPIPGLGLGASMFDIFLFFMSMISTRALQDVGFIISLLIFALLISIPAHAVKNGFYALQRNKDKNAVGGLVNCAVVYGIVALIVFLIPHLASSRAEDRFLMQYGLNNVIPFTTPLIWAACYAVAAVFAHTDKNSEEYRGAVSQTPSNTQENLTQDLTATKEEKTFEPVLGIETEALIKRAFIFISDNDFDEAERYFEQALRQDPENSQAYLGKLMAELKVHNTDELSKISKSLKDEKLFQRALSFANGDNKILLENCLEAQNKAWEEQKKAEIEQKYINALEDKEKISSSSDAQNIVRILKSIAPYKDSEAVIQELEQKKKDFEVLEKNYMNAHVAKRELFNLQNLKNPDMEKFNRVVEMFETLGDYKDCKSLAEEIRNSAIEASKRKNTGKWLMFFILTAIIGAGAFYAYTIISQQNAAKRAEEARIEAEKQEEKSHIEALKLELQGQK